MEPVSLAQVWAKIEAVGPVPNSQRSWSRWRIWPGSEAEEVWWFATGWPLPLLCEVIRFGAALDDKRVLAALRELPRLWGGGAWPGERGSSACWSNSIGTYDAAAFSRSIPASERLARGTE